MTCPLCGGRVRAGECAGECSNEPGGSDKARAAIASQRDVDIARGFSAGNYSNAYETTCLETALARLSMNRSEAYVAAFTLGFFGTHERDEMGSDVDAYDDAMALVGARARALGIAVGHDDDEDPDDHNFGESAW